MRSYYNITEDEMDEFLILRGFQPITLPNVKEKVYGRVIDKNICVRVYTGIVNGNSRTRGEDAIRVTIVKRYSKNIIKPISIGIHKVYRLENWKENLTKKLDNVIDFYFDNRHKEEKKGA